MNGMPYSQGSDGMAMFRMNGMPYSQGSDGMAMFNLTES